MKTLKIRNTKMDLGRTAVLGVSALVVATGGVQGRAEGLEVHGGPDLGYQVVNGERQSAKFNEYRDLTTGFVLGGEASVEQDNYYSNLFLKEIGRNDQSYWVNGGSIDLFKYKVYFNQTPHNLSYNASTFYEGVGTDHLTYTTAPTTSAAWTHTFDYSLKRKDYGVQAQLLATAPFFVDIGASRVTTTGVKPIGTSSASLELPIAVDYGNNSTFVEAGYRKDSLAGSLRYDVSRFTGGSLYSYFENPGNVNREDWITNAPDSTMSKVGFNGALQNLPLNSTLSLRGSLSWLKDEFDVKPKGVTGTTTLTTYTVDNSTFKGDETYKNANINFTSRPLSGLDTRVYYTFFQKKNDSTVITATKSGATPEYWRNELFSYRKNNAGFDAGYRLPWKSRVRAGYEYLNVNREERQDAPTTWDNRYFVKLTNSYFDWMSLGFRAEYLARQSAYEGVNPGQNVAATTASAVVASYLRPFDVANKQRWKLVMESNFEPIEDLNLGLELNWRANKYQDTVIGRTRDQTNEIYANVGYKFSKRLRIGGFVDSEAIRVDANHRFIDSTVNTTTARGNPFTGVTDSKSYNWSSTVSDLVWGYGLNADFAVTESFDIGLAWTQDVSDGGKAFSAMYAAAGLQDILLQDDYRHSIFNLKGTYHLSDRLSATAGFIFDRLFYNDESWNGYVVMPTSSTYLTGAYTDNSYANQVYYVSASYRL